MIPRSVAGCPPGKVASSYAWRAEDDTLDRMSVGDSWGVGRFHDAEVTSVRLDRSGPTLELVVTVDPRSATEHSMILTFRDVTDVDLAGFNAQNALFDIVVAGTPEGQWRVQLASSYGLGGSFQCADLPQLPLAT
jgi:hypothetical protein